MSVYNYRRIRVISPRVYRAMPRRQFDLPKCSYVGQKGVCGQPCFRGVCGVHRNRKSLPLCKNCGRLGTNASHGYCANIESGCRWKAQYHSSVLKADLESWDAFLFF